MNAHNEPEKTMPDGREGEAGLADHRKLISAARTQYAQGSDDDIEIDDDARVSLVDQGAWVQGWLWIANAGGDGA